MLLDPQAEATAVRPIPPQPHPIDEPRTALGTTRNRRKQATGSRGAGFRVNSCSLSHSPVHYEQRRACSRRSA